MNPSLAIVGSLLENFTFMSYAYYMAWAGTGQLISYLFKIWESKPHINKSGGWQWGYFFKDNYKRWISVFIAMSIGVLFTETIFTAIGLPGVKINEITALGMGGFTDVIIKRIFKGSENRALA